LASLNFCFNLGSIWGIIWLVVDQRRIEERYSVLLKGDGHAQAL
jgi:hypothetical protein